MKLRAGLVGAALLFSCVLAACGRGEEEAGETDPTEKLPAKYKSHEPVARPDFAEAAKSATFQQAIRDAAALLGSEPQPLESPEHGAIAGGVSFQAPHEKVEGLLRKAHGEFLARGFFLFRHDNNFGLDGRPDHVGLLPTTDKYAVIATLETNGVNYEIGTAGVIAWLKDLEREQPFVLTAVGLDHLEGHFTTPVRDPKALARRMYEFCPDIVQQGVGSVAKLADEVKKGTLYFWWD